MRRVFLAVTIFASISAFAAAERTFYRFPLEPSGWTGGGEFTFTSEREGTNAFLRVRCDKPVGWDKLVPKRCPWPSVVHTFKTPLVFPDGEIYLRIRYRMSASLDTGLFYEMRTVGVHATARKPAVGTVRVTEDFRNIAFPRGAWMTRDIPLDVQESVTNALDASFQFSHQGNPAPYAVDADFASVELVVKDEPEVRAGRAEWRKFTETYEPDLSDGSDLLLPPKDHRFATPFNVVTNGRPACKIVWCVTGFWQEALASRVTERAALALQANIKRLTGVTIPVNPNHPNFPELRALPAIYIGKGCFRVGEARAKTPGGNGFPDELWRLHGTDGFAIRRVGDELFVFGDTEKGAMNGVFALIENNSDLIWARPNPDFGCVYSKIEGDYAFVWGADVFSKPAFAQVRGIWNMHDPEYWAANGVTTCPGEWGDGRLPWMRGGHNINHFSGGFKEHPEFYGMWNGKRDKDYGNQLCYANPAFVREFAKNVVSEFIGVQADAVRGPTITFDDSYHWCQCPICTAPFVVGRDGLCQDSGCAGAQPSRVDGGCAGAQPSRVVDPGEPGFMSTQAFSLMNAAARELEKKFPGKRIWSQAYYQTSEPPVCEIAHNIDMMYCPYPRSDDAAPIWKPENRIWLDQLKRWRAKLNAGQQLIVRDYLGLGLGFPRPLGFAHARDFQEYCKYADGIDGEGTCVPPDRVNEGNGKEFPGMKTLDLSAIEYWVMFRLMWDPHQDVEKLYKTFVWRTFREAAPEMARFYGIIRREFIRQRIRSGMSDSPIRKTLIESGHTDEMLRLLDEAAAKVRHPSARIHVQRAKARFEDILTRALGFTKAKAVWAKGREKEMNVTLRFTGSFRATGDEKRIFLRTTGSTFYRIRLNGAYVGYGPARGPKGYDRIDEWNLAKFAKKGVNALEIDVTGSSCPCYYVTDQPSYLQAEVVADGKILTATSEKSFVATELNREIKVPRYSFQRPFCEVWNEPFVPAKPSLELAVQPTKKFLPRRAAYPTFVLNEKAERIAEGKVRYDTAVPLRNYRPLLRIGTGQFDSHGYATNVCRVLPTLEADRYIDDPKGTVRAETWDFGLLDCGFIGLKAHAKGKGRIVLSFDEILSDGKVDFLRGGTANVVIWNLDGAGDYALETIEPYAFRYAKIVLDGNIAIERPYIRAYKSPSADGAKAPTDDPVLAKIFEAARETFRQNAVDVFTDCPGRERAGWLCDSFFTARVSKLLTGSLALEELFLENYLLADDKNIPAEMFPMCYPSDHIDKNFIPNWAMWLVLQLDDYLGRGGNPALVKRFEPKVLALVKYLSGFENGDGLLEKLPKWVFVEWSDANKFTQDVNYPSNMTWAKVLETVAKLYKRPDLAKKAESVRATIRKQSYDGKWFCDNAVRDANGKLQVTTNHTETCQYYAFFFGTATPKSHPKLWKTMVDDFGPERKVRNTHPDVPFSNAFVGNYLRLELLQRAGLQDKVEANVRGYFRNMAERTGTLWEMDAPTASCCHGFASYVAVFIDRLKKGEEVAKPPFPHGRAALCRGRGRDGARPSRGFATASGE